MPTRKATVYATPQKIDQSGNLNQSDIDKLLTPSKTNKPVPPPAPKAPEIKLSEAIRLSTVSQQDIDGLITLAKAQQSKKESDAWERDKKYWAEHRHSSRNIPAGPEPKLADSLVSDEQIEALLNKHKKNPKLS